MTRRHFYLNTSEKGVPKKNQWLANQIVSGCPLRWTLVYHRRKLAGFMILKGAGLKCRFQQACALPKSLALWRTQNGQGNGDGHFPQK
jgi:hypothetical protein